mmetsp:Transcript_55682/g.156809  ORF Transcript_55682/g.156809 Transcript_55682/m.156809 type:complete len:254 (-) Transcript_55682:586-1347(-)
MCCSKVLARLLFHDTLAAPAMRPRLLPATSAAMPWGDTRDDVRAVFALGRGGRGAGAVEQGLAQEAGQGRQAAQREREVPLGHAGAPLGGDGPAERLLAAPRRGEQEPGPLQDASDLPLAALDLPPVREHHDRARGALALACHLVDILHQLVGLRSLAAPGHGSQILQLMCRVAAQAGQGEFGPGVERLLRGNGCRRTRDEVFLGLRPRTEINAILVDELVPLRLLPKFACVPQHRQQPLLACDQTLNLVTLL